MLITMNWRPSTTSCRLSTLSMVAMCISHLPARVTIATTGTHEAMWCCVGTGMENHSKYGQFVYTKKNDNLFVNLFVASELN